MTVLSPSGEPVKVAMSVDDLFQWKGMPYPESHPPARTAQLLIDAFANHGHPPVYSFSSTAPVDDEPAFAEVFDQWVDAGHHVGNHTHYHASLNWVKPSVYIDDIKRSEDVIGSYIERAPSKYFRYCMDMWGNSPEKTAQVQAWLAKAGYLAAPLSYWFYDAQFAVPYLRALHNKDEGVRNWILDKFVETAIDQFKRQVNLSYQALGRQQVHIGLLHGTPVTGDAADRVLAGLKELGVEFVTLEEAMADPANVIPPNTVTPMFRNFTQKWAEIENVAVEGIPPREAIAEVRAVIPVEGLDEPTIFGAMFGNMAAGLEGCVPDFDNFDW
ncbi:hypothetical protein DI005_22970 [Prauserella sp. PE36]|uniref:NodB homology domain-containing protein n=1 Tax=Prauserella endophytica TaxID=1592324 RepID=A0ABY2S9L7_9PSEU|nr:MULTISPECIES: polysaccharide deacetylase family protein [Prauserella]PXY23086.1 hypothetical protein BAY59_25560 [Prauserella coralliicola]RBM17155.1 hypothetical protein DI005_22970 [Prauserella sp. PE36]TKG72522.1 hypothetical protein FCN18_04525 [Prauserella endophytica]